jgi:hypothetical protein
MNIFTIVIIIVVCILIYKFVFSSNKTTEHYPNKVYCALMLRRVRNALLKGDITTRQANLYWIMKHYADYCGDQQF